MVPPFHFGKYLLVDKIGTGGMAELYLAKQTGLKGFEKVIAIKRILPHLTQDTEFVNMFINEAKLAALLSHQNIVQIFDLGNVDGMYFIAMEYVIGKDLRTVLRKRRENKTRIPIELALVINSRICSGLDYAHRKKDLSGNDLNIVHRDVSPQNILISYEGEVKIVDFGIAKAASGDSETRAGVLKGKLAYMSPEQAWGKPIDRRTDVYATGIVLYEMLTGERPFKASSDFELLEKVREAGPDPPSKLNAEIYPELEAIVNKALAKDPVQRYQTASEMELALETLIVSKGYGLSSLNLSQYISALFKEEMELDTQRFQMATTVNLSETVIDRTVQRFPQSFPQVEKTSTDNTPRAEKTPLTGRTPSTPRRTQTKPRTHPVINLFLWGTLLLLISAPILVYTRPHLVLKVIHQQAWLHPIEDSVRHHLENLALIQPTALGGSDESGPSQNGQSVALSTPPPQAEVHPQPQPDNSQPVAVQGIPPATEEKTPTPEGSKQAAVPILILEDPVRPIQPSESHKQRPAPPAKPAEPENAELRQLFFMAKRQYEERDLDGLETTLRKIIEKDPGAARAYHLLGTLYLERKDEETALRIFSEAVNLFPRDPMLHHDLGTLYYKRGFHELARQELSKALEVAPSFPKAEQTRKLLLSLKQMRPDQPLQESPPPPPPPPPQDSPDVLVDAPAQNVDEPTAQVNPDPTEQGQTGDQPPPPETGGQ